jgi:hypothetical protein
LVERLAESKGGAKVKNACGAKVAEFRKTSAISSIFNFSSKIFLVKDLTNRFLFPLFVSLWEHTFSAMIQSLKNG